MQRFTRFIVSTINRSHHIHRRNATLALSQQEMSTHNRCFSRSLLRHQLRQNATTTTSKLNNNKNNTITNHSPSNCTLSNHQRVTFHTTRFTNNNNNNNNNSSDQNHQQQQQQQLNSSILYESNSSSPILIAQQAYVRHRNIIWLVGANAALLYLPIVAPALKIITVLSSIVFGYFSKQNNRNHVPTILKSISIDSSDDSRFLLDRFDGRKTSVPIRDVIMDHEPLFKVYMPFGSFFWRSFLLNKSDMRSANELRFMVVKLGDSMREDTRNLSFNREGEVVRTVYTVRADDETLDELRERLEQVRSHHDPPSQF